MRPTARHRRRPRRDEDPRRRRSTRRAASARRSSSRRRRLAGGAARRARRDASGRAPRAEGIEAVGFGVPARIDHAHGRRARRGQHPAARRSASATELEERLGLPVGVENDAQRGGARRVRHGAGRGRAEPRPADARHRRRRRRDRSTASSIRGWAELGHMVIVEDGEPCQGACTGRGHVESYCSGRAADRSREQLLGPRGDGARPRRAAPPGARADRPAPRRRRSARSSTSSTRTWS